MIRNHVIGDTVYVAFIATSKVADGSVRLTNPEFKKVKSSQVSEKPSMEACLTTGGWK